MRDFEVVNFELLWDEKVVQTIEVKDEEMSGPPSGTAIDEARIINSLMVEPMTFFGNGRLGVRVTLDGEVVVGKRALIAPRVPNL